jgi:hypothetical protein
MEQRNDEEIIAKLEAENMQLHSEVTRYRRYLQNNIYAMYFMLMKCGGTMRISKQKILQIPQGHTVINRECFDNGDMEFMVYDAKQESRVVPL